MDWAPSLRQIRRVAWPEDTEMHIYSINNVEHMYSFADKFTYIGQDTFLSSLKSSGYISIPNTLYTNPLLWNEFIESELISNVRRVLSERNEDILADRDLYLSFLPKTLGGLAIGKSIQQYLDQTYENIYDLQAFWRKDFRLELLSDAYIKQVVYKYDLDRRPFLVHQGRHRENPGRGVIFAAMVLNAMSSEFTDYDIVNISYSHSLSENSKSEVYHHPAIRNIKPESFKEQLALIQASAYCIYSSCEDFGSHIYIPPLVGKDVFVVCDNEVLGKESYPLDLWNEQIFRYGGQIYAAVMDLAKDTTRGLESTFNALNQYIRIVSVGEIASMMQNYIATSDYLLWPNTPSRSQEVQKKICLYYGMSDFEDDCLARPRLLEKIITFLINRRQVRAFPIVYEMCAGDGYCIEYSKKRNRVIRAIASDIDPSFLGRRHILEASGVKCTNMLLQQHPIAYRSFKFDLVIMLNTYRSFDHAQLKPIDSSLQIQLCEWFAMSADFLMVSISNRSDCIFEKFEVVLELPGEQDSLYYLLRNTNLVPRQAAGGVSELPILESSSCLVRSREEILSRIDNRYFRRHLLEFSSSADSRDYPLSWKMYNAFQAE